MRIRVMHSGDTSYVEYDVDAIEIAGEVTVRVGLYGSLVILDPTLSADRQGEVKDGSPGT